MTAISQLVAWVVLPSGETVWCESASVTLDEGWAPYAQATVVLPNVPGRAAALDPRMFPRLRLGLRRSWTYRTTLEDLSAAWSGRTLGDLSTEWAGLTLGDLTSQWTTPWDSGTRSADQLDADLVVRSAVVDLVAATITVRAVSDEMLAQGARVTTNRPTEPLSTRLAVLLALAGISTTSTNFAAGDSVMLPPLLIDVDQTVWQAMTDAAAVAPLRLWCDQARTWRLSAPDAISPTEIDASRVESAEDASEVDRDFADVIVWRGTAQGRFTDGTDEWYEPVTSTAKYPAVPTVAPHIVHLWTQDFGKLDVSSIPVAFEPSSSQLAARLARLSSRGRQLTFTAPPNLDARPGQTVVGGAPSLPELDGVAASVSFEIPADTMTVRTRSTVGEV